MLKEKVGTFRIIFLTGRLHFARWKITTQTPACKKRVPLSPLNFQVDLAHCKVSSMGESNCKRLDLEFLGLKRFQGPDWRLMQSLGAFCWIRLDMDNDLDLLGSLALRDEENNKWTTLFFWFLLSSLLLLLLLLLLLDYNYNYSYNYSYHYYNDNHYYLFLCVHYCIICTRICIFEPDLWFWQKDSPAWGSHLRHLAKSTLQVHSRQPTAKFESFVDALCHFLPSWLSLELSPLTFSGWNEGLSPRQVETQGYHWAWLVPFEVFLVFLVGLQVLVLLQRSRGIGPALVAHALNLWKLHYSWVLPLLEIPSLHFGGFHMPYRWHWGCSLDSAEPSWKRAGSWYWIRNSCRVKQIPHLKFWQRKRLFQVVELWDPRYNKVLFS